MFLHRSNPSMCDSRSNSYFDRQHAQFSRYRSDDSHTSNNTSSTMAMTRKRPRVDSQHFENTSTPRASTTALDLDASVSSFGLASPSPLANSDYRLFGGLDTPGTWSELREERVCLDDAERDYRPNRFNQNQQQSYFSDQSAVQRHHSDARLEDPLSASLTGWHLRKTAWALTGGLAGKIFNFCWNTTFRGFQAGAGPAYTEFARDRDHFDHRTKSTLSRYSDESDARNIQQNGRLIDNQAHYTDQQRPIKTPVSYKRQVSEDSMVKNNWVFVETAHLTPEEQSPIRKRSRASIASPNLSSRYSNQTHIPRPATHVPPRTHTASFASPRPRTAGSSSSTATSRTYSNSNTSFGGAIGTNNNTRPISPITTPKSKRPRISMMGPSTTNTTIMTSPSRRQSSYVTNLALAQQQQSPISPEIETYQRKKKRQEKKNDESLRRLNSTLQDMIREGQQALGSKIEIVDSGFGNDQELDEGYFEDDYLR